MIDAITLCLVVKVSTDHQSTVMTAAQTAMLVQLSIYIRVSLDRNWFMIGAGHCAGISLARDSVKP
jgi:hypothetical protein